MSNPYSSESADDLVAEMHDTAQRFLYSNNEGYSVYDSMEEFCQKFEALNKKLVEGEFLPSNWCTIKKIPVSTSSGILTPPGT